jgi:hypothetical protein
MTYYCEYPYNTKLIQSCHFIRQRKTNFYIQKESHVYCDMSGLIDMILLYNRFICFYGKFSFRKKLIDNFIK